MAITSCGQKQMSDFTVIQRLPVLWRDDSEDVISRAGKHVAGAQRRDCPAGAAGFRAS